MKIYYLLLFSLLIANVIFAQKQQIDSIKQVLAKYEKQQNHASDTNYLNLLNELAYKLYTINPDTTILLGHQSLTLCQAAGYEKGSVEAVRNIGISYYLKGDYNQALSHYFDALKIAEKIRYKKGIGRLYNNIASIYSNQGRYPEALENHFKALKIREEIGDKQGIAASLNNIASVYSNEGKYPEALEIHLRSLKQKEEIGDKQGIAYSFNNIASIYSNQRKYDEALENNFKALKIREEIGDKQGIAWSLNNIAGIYSEQGKNIESIENYFKASKIQEEIGDRQGFATAFQGLGNSYLALKQYDKALFFELKGLQISHEIGHKELISGCNDALSKIYEVLGQGMKALYHHRQFKIYADSINNLEVENKTSNLAAEYEYEKKETILKAEQIKKEILHQQQLQKQNYIIYGFIGLLFAVIIVAYLIYLNQQKEKKAKLISIEKGNEILQKNEEINQQKEELSRTLEVVEIQRNELQQKNKDITDSINYAKRIQKAILPFPERIAEGLGKDNFFVLYKPRNIISGDFYFYEQIEEKTVIAVVDCVGHGVPGAFMSMIGNQILTDIIIKNQQFSPDQILNLLHKEVRRTLRQDINTDSRDGMDVAIIVITKDLENKNSMLIEYAGAMSPLFLVHDGEFKEIKADRKAIGGQQYKEETERTFFKHTMQLTKKDEQKTTFYLCTDGFQDQFGGEQVKKFMVKRFRELLFSISDSPMAKQQELLNSTINNWMDEGLQKQTDDITIVGVKL